MSDEDTKTTKSGKKEEATRHMREDPRSPVLLPGIRRLQFFANLADRPLTLNLNRAVMFGIAASLAVDVVKPVINGVPQTLYCYECRACYGTQDKCPVGIAFQAELTVASRVADYERFIKAGGLKCIRCGNCASYCVVNLNLPRIYSRMQMMTIDAMKRGAIPRRVIEKAFREGAINRLFINEVAQWLETA